MTAPRRNEVAVIAGAFPALIEKLTIRLTPSRACALAAFTLRTGIPADALILDLLDDVIFDMAPASDAGLGSAMGTLPNSLGGCGND